MYKTILVPLDGSKRAENILPHVETLAHCMGSKVVVLQVIEPGFTAYDLHGVPPQLNLELTERWLQEAEAYLAQIKADFEQKGIESKAVVGAGPVVDTIIETAEQEQADLIAMASHGRTGLAHVFYGSVSAGVLHQIDRPLLLVRAAKEEG